jgi:hypothetical protein
MNPPDRQSRKREIIQIIVRRLGFLRDDFMDLLEVMSDETPNNVPATGLNEQGATAPAAEPQPDVNFPNSASFEAYLDEFVQEEVVRDAAPRKERAEIKKMQEDREYEYERKLVAVGDCKCAGPINDQYALFTLSPVPSPTPEAVEEENPDAPVVAIPPPEEQAHKPKYEDISD